MELPKTNINGSQGHGSQVLNQHRLGSLRPLGTPQCRRLLMPLILELLMLCHRNKQLTDIKQKFIGFVPIADPLNLIGSRPRSRIFKDPKPFREATSAQNMSTTIHWVHLDSPNRVRGVLPKGLVFEYPIQSGPLPIIWL